MKHALRATNASGLPELMHGSIPIRIRTQHDCRTWSLCLLLFCFASASLLAAPPCVPPDSMRSLLQHNPTAANFADLGVWFGEQKQYACAANAFATSLQMQPDQPDADNVIFMFGVSLFLSGNAKDAIAPLQVAEQHGSRNIKLHLVLAAAFDQLQSTHSAEAEWRAVLALDQQSSAALDSLSTDLLLDNDCAGTITLLEDPMIAGQRTPKQSLNLGLAYSRTNQLEPAATVLRDGLNTLPDSLPIANALADVLVKLGRAQEAGDVLNLALAQHPGDHDTEIHLLQALMAANSAKAPEFARKLLLASPQDWMLLYLNGVIETRGGELQKARSYLEESITLNPDFAVSREALGLVLTRQNELPSAKEQFEKAIELGDDNAEVKQDLSKVMQALGAAK